LAQAAGKSAWRQSSGERTTSAATERIGTTPFVDCTVNAVMQETQTGYVPRIPLGPRYPAPEDASKPAIRKTVCRKETAFRLPARLDITVSEDTTEAEGFDETIFREENP
jgi:hypothetical protein